MRITHSRSSDGVTRMGAAGAALFHYSPSHVRKGRPDSFVCVAFGTIHLASRLIIFEMRVHPLWRVSRQNDLAIIPVGEINAGAPSTH